MKTKYEVCSVASAVGGEIKVWRMPPEPTGLARLLQQSQQMNWQSVDQLSLDQTPVLAESLSL